jgi:hypothetical protein
VRAAPAIGSCRTQGVSAQRQHRAPALRGPRAPSPASRSLDKAAPLESPDLIGWIASAILIATLARQTWRQWREPDPRGVSHGLFAGQMAASAGFVIYSWLLHNWVFIVTNTLILLTAGVGQWVMLRAKRQSADRDQAANHDDTPQR